MKNILIAGISIFTGSFIFVVMCLMMLGCVLSACDVNAGEPETQIYLEPEATEVKQIEKTEAEKYKIKIDKQINIDCDFINIVDILKINPESVVRHDNLGFTNWHYIYKFGDGSSLKCVTSRDDFGELCSRCEIVK